VRLEAMSVFARCPMLWHESYHQRTRTVDRNRAHAETFQSSHALIRRTRDEVRNLPQVELGDKVNARYHASVAGVLAPPGTKLPDNSVITQRTSLFTFQPVSGTRPPPGCCAECV